MDGVAPLLSRVDDWRAYLVEGLELEQTVLLCRQEPTGCRLDSMAFL